MYFDLDGDGVNETTGWDRDGDGRVDCYLADFDGDGRIDVMMVDTSGDGLIDTVAFDHNGDGILDEVVPVAPPADPSSYLTGVVGGNSGPGYTIIDPNTGQDITGGVHPGSTIVGAPGNPAPGLLNDHNLALNEIWLH